MGGTGQEIEKELKGVETIKGWPETGSCAAGSSGQITGAGSWEDNGGFISTILTGAELAYHGLGY